MRMAGLLACGLAAALTLAGCQTVKEVFVRTDGQTTADNPHLAAQFEIDKTVCEGDSQRASLTGSQFCLGDDCLYQAIARQQGRVGVVKGCMAQKGYLSVPEDQAAAKSEQFRAAHQAQLRANAAPPPPQRR